VAYAATLNLSDLPDLVSEETFCKWLGITMKTAWRWRQLGDAPRLTKLGNKPYYSKPDIESWIKSRGSKG
jgi:predicted DNA-binding transcriptional regulator AlpA